MKGCSKLQKGSNKAGTFATLNNCSFIVSKDFKLSHVGEFFTLNRLFPGYFKKTNLNFCITP